MITIQRLQALPAAAATLTAITPDGVKASVSGSWEDIATTAPPQLTHETKRTDGATLHTSKLTFTACKPLPQGRLLFLLTLTTGARLLLSPPCRPWPVATMERTLPADAKASPLPAYTVSVTDTHGPLPLL